MHPILAICGLALSSAEHLSAESTWLRADPPKYGLGYWLAKEATGQGYASAALRALIGHARIDLYATDIYAGVTRGNAKSEALLERLGFLPVLDFDSYRRFHLNLR